MKYTGFLDLSTIDFPGHVCSVVFLVGCPFRCPYCHNHQLLTQEGIEITPQKLTDELTQNYLVDGICVTGGEPLLQKDTIEFAKCIKSTGFAFKLDTNGYYPENLNKILPHVDYVAIDLKTSPEKYPELTGKKDSWKRIEKSLKILSNYNVKWEARTTVVPVLVWENELKEISDIVNEFKPDKYVIQQFNNENPLDEKLKSVNIPQKEELIRLAKIVDFPVTIRCMDGEFIVG